MDEPPISKIPKVAGGTARNYASPRETLRSTKHNGVGGSGKVRLYLVWLNSEIRWESEKEEMKFDQYSLAQLAKLLSKEFQSNCRIIEGHPARGVIGRKSEKFADKA
ncbi:hypothetical protein VNO78_05358 [Psophocarpus tetragonolobus]|uniref:Uncharacterized protein n=1 Tax=Psophocarpus tetragonolobus TaxID=3891 RepID=A0AAN9XQU1_PSOTE